MIKQQMGLYVVFQCESTITYIAKILFTSKTLVFLSIISYQRSCLMSCWDNEHFLKINILLCSTYLCKTNHTKIVSEVRLPHLWQDWMHSMLVCPLQTYLLFTSTSLHTALDITLALLFGVSVRYSSW